MLHPNDHANPCPRWRGSLPMVAFVAVLITTFVPGVMHAASAQPLSGAEGSINSNSQGSEEADKAFVGEWKLLSAGSGTISISGGGGHYTGTVSSPVSFGSGCVHPVGEVLFTFELTGTVRIPFLPPTYKFTGTEVWYTDECKYKGAYPTWGELTESTVFPTAIHIVANHPDTGGYVAGITMHKK